MSGDSAEAIPDRGELRNLYEKRRSELELVLVEMESRIRKVLEAASLRPTIKGRVKSFDSWYAKKIRFLRQARGSGGAVLPITDLVAIRAVCPFLGDLESAERALCAAFQVVEIERKGSDRSFREFGYESIHLLLSVPEEFGAVFLDPPVVEVQLRTILQEAWAEVEHELVYKAEFTPFDEPMKRKLAALNANLSLSDIIFQEILDYQRRLNHELERRRSAFHGKIEDAMDRPIREELDGKVLAAGSLPDEDAALDEVELGRSPSMDDLLLAALSAHNREHYDKAVRLYGEILAGAPPREVASVVYKHRGMAFFSQSRYAEAIEDFGMSLSLDPGCYKSAYYRGVVRSVLQDFSGAIADFDLALSIHPYHFYSRYRRGMAFWHMGDYPQALADSEAALKLEPESESARRLRTLSLERLAM